MRTPIQVLHWQRTERFVLSIPAQAILYVALWSLILWLVFFSTYPLVHDTVHSLRHHTLGVSCH
ncbi:cobalt transporter subunit (CbtB) [Aphanothece hegewaldii CCALA 016]|uniref:Cobalt transporter subunit (CbtB) n=1 Tax=Aphanothece hegewaldii CCALA 016 TaxID=2107694 RepID=A0A2T1LZ15_9CHRO|nr:CbtB-domain containing protein [Aphanothece hegewaldii]PSF37642.1 cobalt transporter subunit (CbtB) [Aphanothece hegewaldii CCALA 016]